MFTSSENRIDEVRALLRLAGPLIVNNLSIAGMQFADAVMAGRLGAEALAAVAVGGSVWFLCFTVCLGLMMAISPIAARHYGAGEQELIGRYTRQGIWLAAALGLTFFTLIQLFAAPVLGFLGIDPGFRELTIGYSQAIVWGAPAICAWTAPGPARCGRSSATTTGSCRPISRPMTVTISPAMAAAGTRTAITGSPAGWTT